MYRARDQLEEAEWLEELTVAASDLELSPAARSTAVDLFLSTTPSSERSKRASIAASLYAASLIAGEECSQSAVAESVGVSRLVVQDRWKPLLEAAGFTAPTW